MSEHVLSPYFKRKEFSCRCGCGFAAVDSELLHVLEDVRQHFNAPLVITGPCRCEAHNRKVGGAKSSYHVKGMAVDIKVSGVKPSEVYLHLTGKYPHKYGVGKYPTFTHIDVRSEQARWNG